jgi:DNA-binding MarR family transcriptional regulator
VNQLDRRLFFLINRVHRLLLTRAGAVLDAELGISVAQLTSLMYVVKRPGCSLTELADVLDLNKSAVTGLVQRMERAGTLRREANPEDARGSRLFVTPRGEELHEHARPLVKQLNADLVQGFSPAEIETVLRFLNVTLHRLQTEEAEP